MKKFLKSHKKSFLLQTEICAKNLALANVNYSISDNIEDYDRCVDLLNY